MKVTYSETGDAYSNFDTGQFDIVRGSDVNVSIQNIFNNLPQQTFCQIIFFTERYFDKSEYYYYIDSKVKGLFH